MLSSQRGACVRAVLRAWALDRVRSVVCKSAKCTTRTFFVGQGDLEVEVCSRRPVLYVAAVSLILRISDLGGLQCPKSARVPAAARTPEQWGWATSAVAAVGGGGGILQLTHPSAAPQMHPLSSPTRSRMTPVSSVAHSHRSRPRDPRYASMLRRPPFPVADSDDAECRNLCTPGGDFSPSLARASAQGLQATRHPGRRTSASACANLLDDINPYLTG